MDPQTPEIPVTPPVEPPKPKDSHWITILAMALFVLAALSITGFLYYQNQQLKQMLATYQSQPSPTAVSTPTPVALETPTASSSGTPVSTQKACTLEAKLCPDGSYVGRTGPNCEFAACP
jgi:hypothetical protein